MKKCLLIIFYAVLTGCAHQVTPSGGPKDITPPKITYSNPENFSTSFKGNRIELHFDEYVQIKNFTKEVLVTPALKKPLKYKLKGKKLIIEIADTLLPNATYVFNFGKSIMDINEGNPLDSNVFVFSTGNVLDSLKINGKVIDAFSLEPQKDISVFLYASIKDSLLFKSIPDYITYTNEDGSFEFTYLPATKFQLAAAEDINNNKKADVGEKIAFTNSLVSSQDTLPRKLLLYLPEIKQKQYVKSTVFDENKARILLNLPENNLEIQYLSSCEDCFLEQNKTSDTITIWTKSDSLKIALFGANFSDTLQLLQRKKKKKTQEKIYFKPLYKNHNYPYFKNILLEAGTPLKQIDSAKFIIVTPGDTLYPKVLLSNNRQIELRHPLKEKTNYKVIILPQGVTDIFEITNNDTIQIPVQTNSHTEYANLKLTISGAFPSSYILNLIKENTVQKTAFFQKDTMLQFKNLPHGDYQLKLVFDQNKNQKWDGGNYAQKQLPEKVIYYPEKVKMPKGWDVDITWDLNHLNNP
ncbi:MAG: hypothetical protein D6707_09550 [Bacteroidetes bacterium]|nr:MAG: hypothetical protein D6707_09550 [Bacteroidota bacterium]